MTATDGGHNPPLSRRIVWFSQTRERASPPQGPGVREQRLYADILTLAMATEAAPR